MDEKQELFEKVLTFVKEVEWCGYDAVYSDHGIYPSRACPFCHHIKTDPRYEGFKYYPEDMGHKHDCKLVAFINDMRLATLPEPPL
jgi:hypothetical protein